MHLKQSYSKYGHLVYAAIMSYNRMLFINSMITFDDHECRSYRWKTDKFAAFRAVFEMFIKSCAGNMSPDDFNDIDETLYPTRDISFKTYNKDKSAKLRDSFSEYRELEKAVCLLYLHPNSAVAFCKEDQSRQIEKVFLLKGRRRSKENRTHGCHANKKEVRLY